MKRKVIPKQSHESGKVRNRHEIKLPTAELPNKVSSENFQGPWSLSLLRLAKNKIKAKMEYPKTSKLSCYCTRKPLHT